MSTGGIDVSYAEGTKKPVLLALTVEQHRKLKLLNQRTRVPMQVYMREAIDDLLVKYKKELRI